MTLETLKTTNQIPGNVSITDLSIKDSSGASVTGALENYDVYTVNYKLNNRNVTENFITVPNTSLTLTNVLTNASFESDLTDYYNETPYRSSTIKRTGNYSMYFTCNNTQAFLRVKYGDIGLKDNDVYVRIYTYKDNSSLSPLIYLYETETNEAFSTAVSRNIFYFGDSYNKWVMASRKTTPTSSNYSYFMIQYAQGNGNGTGNVYWDDVMALVLDNTTWDSIPTLAWLDKMIPDFTGNQTFNW